MECSGVVRSCLHCMTDLCVDFTWKGEAKGWLIKVVKYHQFGKCRSPQDWDWRNMIHKGDQCLNDMRVGQKPFGEFDPGVVRHRWSRGDAAPQRVLVKG